MNVDTNFAGEGTLTEIAGAINYYLNGHSNKLSLDVTFLDESDDDIGFFPAHRFDKGSDGIGIMLSVSVKGDDEIIPVVFGKPEPGLDGAAISDIEGNVQDHGLLFTGDFRCTVRGTVVDDEDVGTRAAPSCVGEHLTERNFFVEGRDDDQAGVHARIPRKRRHGEQRKDRRRKTAADGMMRIISNHYSLSPCPR